jgi:hypothetical protein
VPVVVRSEKASLGSKGASGARSIRSNSTDAARPILWHNRSRELAQTALLATLTGAALVLIGIEALFR